MSDEKRTAFLVTHSDSDPPRPFPVLREIFSTLEISHDCKGREGTNKREYAKTHESVRIPNNSKGTYNSEYLRTFQTRIFWHLFVFICILENSKSVPDSHVFVGILLVASPANRLSSLHFFDVHLLNLSSSWCSSPQTARLQPRRNDGTTHSGLATTAPLVAVGGQAGDGVLAAS